MGRKRIKEFAFLDQLDKPKQPNKSIQLPLQSSKLNALIASNYHSFESVSLLSDNGGY